MPEIVTAAVLTESLQRPHGAGLIYRDVHPDNIFLVPMPTPPGAPARFAPNGQRGGRDADWDEIDAFGDYYGSSDGNFSLAWVLADSTFTIMADEAAARAPLEHGSVTPQ
jgi:hypothetical protein